MPIVLVLASLPLWGRISAGVLGALSLATTAGLAHAGRAQEITIAVDPFDMAFPAFQGLSGLFPLYTWWTVETWWLTYFWFAVAGVATGAVAWPEVTGIWRRLNSRTALHDLRDYARSNILAPAAGLFKPRG